MLPTFQIHRHKLLISHLCILRRDFDARLFVFVVVFLFVFFFFFDNGFGKVGMHQQLVCAPVCFQKRSSGQRVQVLGFQTCHGNNVMVT